MTGGILITPELVVRCIAGTWDKRAIYSTVKQAQVICVLRAAGFIDGPDLSMEALRAAADRISAESVDHMPGTFAGLTS